MAMMRFTEDRRLHVHSGEPSLLRFDVINEQGARVGIVADLVADTERMKVPFAIVELTLPGMVGRQVIVPMWEVQIDEQKKQLICADCDVDRVHRFTVVEAHKPLPEDLNFRFRATFIPATDEPKQPLLPEGHAGTEVTPDARILGSRPRGITAEFVDHGHVQHDERFPRSDLHVMDE